MINIDSIKTKLLNYGLTFEDFKQKTGNLVGNYNVPSLLRSFNKNLTPEEAFYLVANKVYIASDLIAFGIPELLGEKYSRVISYDDQKNFKTAIYEEINQRYLSNSFPEFQNQGSISFGSISQSNGYAGGTQFFQWVNPISQQLITNINWLEYDADGMLEKDKSFAFSDLANVKMSNSLNWELITVLSDGTLYRRKNNWYASNVDYEKTKSKVLNNISNISKNQNSINSINSQITRLATKDEAKALAMAFSQTTQWDSETTYDIPSYVIHDKQLFWNLRDNNINHIPGGVDSDWWELISHIADPKIDYDKIVTNSQPFITDTINDNLDNLPGINLEKYSKDQIVCFENQQDADAFFHDKNFNTSEYQLIQDPTNALSNQNQQNIATLTNKISNLENEIRSIKRLIQTNNDLIQTNTNVINSISLDFELIARIDMDLGNNGIFDLTEYCSNHLFYYIAVTVESRNDSRYSSKLTLPYIKHFDFDYKNQQTTQLTAKANNDFGSYFTIRISDNKLYVWCGHPDAVKKVEIIRLVVARNG